MVIHIIIGDAFYLITDYKKIKCALVSLLIY